MSIITSLLDSDLYKISMMQFVFHNFSNINVEYKFKNRGIQDLIAYKNTIKKEIDHLCTLQFTTEEIKYLKSLGYFTDDFLDFLKYFKLNSNHIILNNDYFGLTIKRSWLSTILLETPVMAIISEVYNEQFNSTVNMDIANERLSTKIELILKENIPFNLVEFGTRRRFSRQWQEIMINRLSSYPFFKGTSNMEFAMKYNLPVIGTHAHELFMVMESIVHPKDSQRFALDMWLREYKGNLAVALTDIFGIDTFIKDCDSHLLRAYNGFRHDSGDPYEFAKKIIQLLKNHNINPMEKMIIWSDGLTIQRALNLTKTFNKEIKTMCGIGTHLSNDNNAEPLNMVIKITKANGLDVCKLSDSPGKIMCENQTYIDYLKQIFNIGI